MSVVAEQGLQLLEQRRTANFLELLLDYFFYEYHSNYCRDNCLWFLNILNSQKFPSYAIGLSEGSLKFFLSRILGRSNSEVLILYQSEVKVFNNRLCTSDCVHMHTHTHAEESVCWRGSGCKS